MKILNEAVMTVIDDEDDILDGSRTVTDQDVIAYIRGQLSESEERWIDGIQCKVLKPGGNWQTGKIKIAIAFIPDIPTQPVSILDDLRKD